MKYFATLIVLAFMVSVVSSCSGSKKKSRGFEIKNGFIYKIGGTDPYTGRIKAVVLDKMMEYGFYKAEKTEVLKLNRATVLLLCRAG